MTPEEQELHDLGNDVFWTEKGHFAMAGMWRATHLCVGLIAAVSSAFAAGVLAADGSAAVAGVASVISAIAAGLLTFLKPRDAADRHLEAGRHLARIRVEIRQCRRLELLNSAPAALHARIAEFATSKAETDASAPHLPNIAMWVVQRRVGGGAFEDTSADGS